MTKTDAIRKAVMSLATARQAEWDAMEDLRSLTIVLRFSPEHLEPRAVVDSVERERRREGR